jgi:SAM-dependent methyltransferase
MKERLLQYIACPACSCQLSITGKYVKDGDEIISGTLLCQCGRTFIVRNSIPILLLGEFSRTKQKTAESFGYEWKAFPHLFGAYRMNFLYYLYPLTEVFFKDKVILDAGSGNGRHSYWAAKFGAREVVAMDISDAAFVTHRNTAMFANVHVVQGDIMHPPFKKNAFDFIFSIGVLHHLEDPEKGFTILTNLIRSGGTLAIWVYGRAHNIANVYIYESLRIITRRIPYRILHLLSYIPACGVQLMNYAYMVLLKIPLARRYASYIPFSYYAQFPFCVKVNDAFDIFSAPKSTYWRKEQIELWYKNGGFADFSVSYLRMKGIRAFGMVR